MQRLALTALALSLVACGGEAGSNLGKQAGTFGFSQARIALRSSSNQPMLRLGQALTLESLDFSDLLLPDTKYTVALKHKGSPVFQGDLLTNLEGKFEASTLAHDAGEFGDGFSVGDTLEVVLDDGNSLFHGTVDIEKRTFLGPGWTVDAATTPHVYTSDDKGNPTNAFVIGGRTGEEVKGPIYVQGDHFPAGQTVQVYVVKDRDDWKKRAFPKQGDPDWIAGPIPVLVDADGKLPLTSTGFTPTASEHLGPFDIIVDLDGNGIFDWSLTMKDAADGENKVGFTVQYSRKWLEQFTSKHLVVNLAYDSKNRRQGSYRNSYSAGMVYGYVNPPVFNQRKDYHTRGIYVMIEHQSWGTFWNNPDPKLDAGCPGCRNLKPYMVHTGGGPGNYGVPLQPGCMNGPPVGLLNAKASALNKDGEPVKSFDLVFLANRKNKEDLIYIPGRDLLDLNMVNTTSGLVDPKVITDASAKGFSVK